MCNNSNIELITSSVEDHRSIELVDLLNSDAKKETRVYEIGNGMSRANKYFIVPELLHKILNQLRSCKERTLKVSPFKALFCRLKNSVYLILLTTKTSADNINWRYVEKLFRTRSFLKQ